LDGRDRNSGRKNDEQLFQETIGKSVREGDTGPRTLEQL
jgi:hypothetical protein